ncbi:2'-5' RNA ligase family protein [Paludibacterium sp. B53371]|uniref:2'-5' RNA ligase family protein n=1 Tax=Paludibacterium sp. B53371 TaxID=2806263 RepID=UPI001C05EB92|nr:2'-5' RNA ligase family protein [Paludibacterium sp. B53371]
MSLAFTARSLRAVFLSAGETQASTRGDFSAWHHGRPWFWFWAIDAALPAIVERVQRAQQCLAPYLLDDYVRAPHVTLSLCGFPPTDTTGEGEYDGRRLDAQCHALRQLARRPFELQVAELDSFRSAPFLWVRDPAQQLPAVRACLSGHPQDHAEQEYVPHVTVGLYSAAWPSAPLARLLQEFDPGPVLKLPVERLSLMRYASHEIGGQLETMADFWLGSQQLIWRPAFSQLAGAFRLAGGAADDCCQ